MKKIQALREALGCSDMSEEVRYTLKSIVDKYDYDRENNTTTLTNGFRREEVLKHLSKTVPMTAKEISDIMDAIPQREREYCCWFGVSSQSVAGLLRKAITDGDAVVDHKEITTFTIGPFNKEVPINFYRRVR